MYKEGDSCTCIIPINVQLPKCCAIRKKSIPVAKNTVSKSTGRAVGGQQQHITADFLSVCSLFWEHKTYNSVFTEHL